MELTTDEVKDLSVSAVEKFINDKVSLNDSIIKTASDLGLNTDQVQRVVEATNQIAFLKLLKTAENRTFEFPLADYEKIVDEIKTPMQEKKASTVRKSPLDLVSDPIEKQASAEDFLPCEQDRRVALYQQYEIGKSTLVKMAHQKAELLMSLTDSAKQLSKDAEGLEKLAEVADELTFKALSKFLGMEKTASMKTDLVFRDKDLDEARKFVGLYKQAKDLGQEYNKLETSVYNAKEFLMKEAGRRSGVGRGAASGVTNTVGKAVGAGITGAAGASFAAGGLAARAAKKVGWNALGIAGAPKPKQGVWSSIHGE